MANKKRIAASGGAAALAGLMILGGGHILVYLTDSETATNTTFTVGKVKVDLTEPDYPGDGSTEVTNLVPNEPVDKDPQATNTGVNNEAIFMSYDIPMTDVIIVGNDGRLFVDEDGNYYINAVKDGDKWYSDSSVTQMLGSTNAAAQMAEDGIVLTEVAAVDREASHQEIFGVSHTDDDGETYVSGARDEDGESWILIRTVYVDELGNEIAEVKDATEEQAASAAAVRRVYAYTSLLEIGDSTESLFDQVTLKNVIEGEIDSTIQEITVKVYAIQASYLLNASGENIFGYNEDTDDASSNTISEADALAIYDIYVGQNGTNVDSAEADNSNALDLSGDARTADQMYIKVSMSVNDTRLNVSDTAKATVAVDSNYDYDTISYSFAAADDTTGTTGTDVISVDDNDVITALKPGVAYIIVTAQSSDGGDAATAYVKVTVDNELFVTLEGDSGSILSKGETMQLTATAVTVPDGADVTYTYKSSNEAGAMVDANGLVTAGESGSAVITVTATAISDVDGSEITATGSFDIYVQN